MAGLGFVRALWLLAITFAATMGLATAPMTTAQAVPAYTYDAACHTSAATLASGIDRGAAHRASESSAAAWASAVALCPRGFVAADEGAAALSYSAKITKQMGPRGWTQDSISETVKNPADTHSVWDYTTGDKQPATAYVRRGDGYVVVNDTTNEIVQVSDLNNSNWKPVWNDPRFQL